MSTTQGPLRRIPAQRRSAERVQRMLDACAEILAESGYAGLTTTRVAERAGVAIGSVYQFFPDKRALTQALTLRYLELFSDRVALRLAEQPYDHWWDTVGAIIDVYVDMHRTVPGFRTLHFGDVVDLHLLDDERDNNTVLAFRLRILLTEAFGIAETPEFARAIAVAIEAGDAVLKMAFRVDPDGDPVFLAEAERLIRGYLAHHFDS